MGYLVLNPAQFGVLESACEHSDKIVSYQKTGDYTGVITTHDVTVDYTYDPLKGQLNFNIGAKHSLAAKIAGDGIISNHITAIIHSLEYPVPLEASPENPTPIITEPAVPSTIPVKAALPAVEVSSNPNPETQGV